VTRRFPSHYRKAIITLSLLGGLASTVFIPLVAWMVQHVGWRQAVEVLALLQLLLCLPLHAMLLHAPDTPNAARPRVAPPPSAELKQLLRSAPYLLVCAFVILMTTVSAALPIHLVSMLHSFQLDESWAVIVPASMGVFQVASRLLLYFVEKRLDVHLANRVIPMLMPLGLLMLLVASAVAPAIAVGFALGFVALFGMGNGMLTIVKGTAIAQYVSPTHVASLNGAMGIPLALARACAPLALAALWSTTWGYSLGLGALLLLSIMGVGALWLAQKSSGAHNASFPSSH
jgi:predicted MFS family arabinose efflux permease